VETQVLLPEARFPISPTNPLCRYGSSRPITLAELTSRMNLGVLGAIVVIDRSNRSAAEKEHLRQLVGGMRLSAEYFAGTPDFDKILTDFPLAPAPSGICSVLGSFSFTK
jgi:hypothetical protein